MKLSKLVDNRDNNFNLIRILSAILVLVSHSYALSLGKGTHDPIGLGGKAVDVFFFTSGFLVTLSLMRSRSIIKFAASRILRIYPALVVMTLLTTTTLGLYASDKPFIDFAKSPTTKAYLWSCSTLIWGVSYELPGVFENNPYPKAVNGSLWTMPYEMYVYMGLATLWLLANITGRNQYKTLAFMVFTYAGCCLFFIIDNDFNTKLIPFIRLSFIFSLGSLFSIAKSRLIISWPIFLLTITLSSTITLTTGLDKMAWLVTLPYLVLFVAYDKSLIFSSYNKIGDYSYGLYIYAFPVQQFIASKVTNITPGNMIIASSIITLILSALSWHMIEQHALKLKRLF